METGFDRDAPLRISADVIASEVDNEIVLIGIDSGCYFGLDAIGTEIWKAIQSPVSFNALSALLQQQFKGDPARIDADALTFVTRLIERRLVETA